ncbi:hypothetical protein KKG55_07485 [Candidatus Micrarchaeota archaeon]|nr:hypothetical protein [Candidatus Micrarchaeota archaeon]MBU1887561.1 hypothetical protein [Candidatus Micrarchaeota archaeon]
METFKTTSYYCYGMVLEVVFAPTQSNKVLIAKFKEMPGLRKCRFKALSEEPDRRNMELFFLRGRMAYIWGDGNRHGESFFFTLDPRIKLKICYDQHSDEYRNYDGNEPKNVSDVDCSNHMTATKMTDTKTLGMRNHLQFVHKEYRYLTDKIAGCEIATTIDCDLLPAFPVQAGYILPNNGGNPDLLINSISDIVPKIYRLDLGGLIEEIPDFELLEQKLIRIPTMEETLEFVNMPSGTIGPETKKVLNLVGSYATMFYANVLEVFSRSFM